MATATQPQTETDATRQTSGMKTAQEEYRFTKAQMRHFNKLSGDIEQAKRDLEKAESIRQDYIGYLSEEHDLDSSKPWVIGPQGFMLAPEQPNSPNGDGNGDGEQGQQSGGTPGTEEGQTQPPQE